MTKHNVKGFKLFDGSMALQVGDKVEFILNPNHLWADLVPMATGVICDVDSEGDHSLIVVQEGDAMVVIDTTLEWYALVRLVPQDTEITVWKVLELFRKGGAESLMYMETVLEYMQDITAELERELMPKEAKMVYPATATAH